MSPSLQVFQGNYERYLVVVHRLRPSIKARYIRVHPRSWYGYVAMRLELYGCRLGKLCCFEGTLSCKINPIKNTEVTIALVGMENALKRCKRDRQSEGTLGLKSLMENSLVFFCNK